MSIAPGPRAVAGLAERLILDCRSILLTPGARAEVSLYTPFEIFLRDAFVVLRPGASGYNFIQQANAEQTGVPDFRLQHGHELQGWVEVKAVLDKDLNNLTGHDKAQLERFVNGLDNVIYTTGWQWRLYQHGKQIGRDVVLGPNSMFDPHGFTFPVSEEAAAELTSLLENYLAAPSAHYVKAADAVRALAIRAKALKAALVQAGRAGAGLHLAQLEADFKALLYRNGLPFTWERFVDSYVQLATFGSLLWRLEARQDINLDRQVGLDVGLHPLLAQCLSILWAPQGRFPMLTPLLEELCRTVNNISPDLFAVTPVAQTSGRRQYLPDPIVHAYEPFFEVYDSAAREANGVFYTPVQIVEHMVSGINDLLVNTLHRADGLLDDSARFLDPATGTGTYLLGLANAVAGRAAAEGLPVDQMVEQVLTKHSAAFELFPGPYTIAHQRLEAALHAFGVTPTERLPVYLADTLAAPVAGTLDSSGFGLAGNQIQQERAAADRLKTAESILVIFGNPPYERVLESKGGGFEPFGRHLLGEIKNATPEDYRADLKSTKDLFVAFWAWALWALQSPARRLATAQQPTITPSDCNGIAAFITNRTWISGRSLAGLRSLVRQGAKEIWVADLGGDSRGAHGAAAFAGGDGNVFNIRTGVAIVWAVFDRDYIGAPKVYYRRLYGTRSAKLSTLEAPFNREDYETVLGDGVATFLPNKWGESSLRNCTRLDALFADEPETGVQTARDKNPYRPLGTQKAEVYSLAVHGRETRAVGTLGDWSRLGNNQRYNAWKTAQSVRAGVDTPKPGDLTESNLRQYVYRPLDFRWLYDDPAWIDWYRPGLHAIYANQRKVPSLVTIPRNHGAGPAVMHTDLLMDQHAFNNRGAKGVFSLWHPHEHGQRLPDRRTVLRDGLRSGFAPAVYDWLEQVGRAGAVEDAYDYLLAVLSAPGYTRQNWEALEADFLRVPLTSDAGIINATVMLGRRLRTAWTLETPRHPEVSWRGASPAPLGSATHDGNSLRFANQRELSGVTAEMWAFEISEYRVLPKWFENRKH